MYNISKIYVVFSLILVSSDARAVLDLCTSSKTYWSNKREWFSKLGKWNWVRVHEEVFHRIRHTSLCIWRNCMGDQVKSRSCIHSQIVFEYVKSTTLCVYYSRCRLNFNYYLYRSVDIRKSSSELWYEFLISGINPSMNFVIISALPTFPWMFQLNDNDINVNITKTAIPFILHEKVFVKFLAIFRI